MEAAGFSTVSLSFLGALTQAMGAPRVAHIEYPSGRPLGQPGDKNGQLGVLRATFDVLTSIRQPGTLVRLPFEWPEAVADVNADPPQPAPVVKLLKRKPWLYKRLLEL